MNFFLLASLLGGICCQCYNQLLWWQWNYGVGSHYGLSVIYLILVAICRAVSLHSEPQVPFHFLYAGQSCHDLQSANDIPVYCQGTYKDHDSSNNTWDGLLSEFSCGSISGGCLLFWFVSLFHFLWDEKDLLNVPSYRQVRLVTVYSRTFSVTVSKIASCCCFLRILCKAALFRWQLYESDSCMKAVFVGGFGLLELSSVLKFLLCV